MPHDQTITWYSMEEKQPPINQASTKYYMQSDHVLARTATAVYTAYIIRFDPEDDFEWYVAHDGDGSRVPGKVLEWAHI